VFYVDDKIWRFYLPTKSTDFCMTDDRFLLADFIGREIEKLVSHVTYVTQPVTQRRPMSSTNQPVHLQNMLKTPQRWARSKHVLSTARGTGHKQQQKYSTSSGQCSCAGLGCLYMGR